MFISFYFIFETFHYVLFAKTSDHTSVLGSMSVLKYFRIVNILMICEFATYDLVLKLYFYCINIIVNTSMHARCISN